MDNYITQLTEGEILSLGKALTGKSSTRIKKYEFDNGKLFVEYRVDRNAPKGTSVLERTKIYSVSAEIEDYGFEYLSEHDPDLEPYDMGEFNELTNYGDDPLEAITRAFYGGRYGFKNDSFNPNDEYFAYNGYGNLISIKDYDINDYLKEHIDESYFYDWCVEQGYFESDEDEEE